MLECDDLALECAELILPSRKPRRQFAWGADLRKALEKPVDVIQQGSPRIPPVRTGWRHWFVRLRVRGHRYSSCPRCELNLFAEQSRLMVIPELDRGAGPRRYDLEGRAAHCDVLAQGSPTPRRLFRIGKRQMITGIQNNGLPRMQTPINRLRAAMGVGVSPLPDLAG